MGNLRTIGLLVVAGLLELSGAYLIWQWVREGKSAWLAFLGLGALLLYGITQSQQAFGFGRVFAAYGGVFIALALVWGWLIEGQSPDRWDLIGASLALIGAAVILWAPR